MFVVFAQNKNGHPAVAHHRRALAPFDDFPRKSKQDNSTFVRAEAFTMGKKSKRSNKATCGGDKGKSSAGRARRERAAATKEIEASIQALAQKFEEELKDLDVFCPIAEREDCLICFLPLPLNEREVVHNACCGKDACSGCVASHIRAINGPGSSWSWGKNDTLSYSCPFFRYLDEMGLEEGKKDKPPANNANVDRLKS